MIYDESPIRRALPPMAGADRLDLGEKTIGVAVTDSFLSIATPLENRAPEKFWRRRAARLSEIIAARRTIGRAGAGNCRAYGRIRRPPRLSVHAGLCAQL